MQLAGVVEVEGEDERATKKRLPFCVATADGESGRAV